MKGYEKVRNTGVVGRIKFLFKDAAIYGGASAVARFLSVFTVPILTRIFTKAEFGAIDAISVFGALIIPIIFMGMDTAIAFFFYENEDVEEKKAIISQPFILGTTVAIITTIALYFNAEAILDLYLGDTQYVEEFKVVIMALPFMYFTQFFVNILKWTFQQTKYLIITVGTSVITIGLTLIFVVLLEYGIIYVFIAQFIAQFISGILGIYFNKSYLVFTRKTNYFRPLFNYGFPFVIVSFLVVLIPSMDRYIISHNLGLEALGPYSFGLKVASLLLLIDRGIQTAWGPFYLALYKEKNAGETFNKSFFVLSFFLVLAGVSLIAFEYPLILIFGSEKYLESHSVIPILAFSIIGRSFAGLTSIGINLSKKTVYHIITYSISFVITAGLMYLLIEPLGLVGVALGLLIARVVLVIIQTYFSNRLYKDVQLKLGKPLLMFTFGAVVSIALDQFFYLGWWQVVIGIFVIISFGVFTFFVIMDKAEQKRLNILVNNLLSKIK